MSVIFRHKVTLGVLGGVIAQAVVTFGAAAAMAAAHPLVVDDRTDTVVEALAVPPRDNLLHQVSFHAVLEAGEVADVAFADDQAIRDFYDSHHRELVFLAGDDWLARLENILALFDESWTHGLNPADYHVEILRRMMNDPLRIERARLELLLADALVRYGRDMTGMRVDPVAIGQQAKFWRAPMTGAAALEAVAKGGDDYAATLASWAPQSLLYKTLREELVHLSAQEDRYDGVLPLDFGVPYFQPGYHAPAVAGLRTRLGVAVPSNIRRTTLYDEELVAAVKAFQQNYEIEPDGIIGPQTLMLLNRTRRAQMEQIIANMERLRWMPVELPERYIMVNIPSQMAWGIEKGAIAVEMPVVVGLPFRQTKSFTTQVTGIRLNPTWTVPLSLKMQDFLPKLKEDPGYLADKGIELIRGYGKRAELIDPYTVDWGNMSWRAMGKLRMVQVPGDHNALGRVRVLMQNEFDIYMHDTNHPEFFEKIQRTYSSGCIRLARPYDMARFIMAGQHDWSEETMQEILSTLETVDLPVDRALTAYVVYQTIWLNRAGQLVYGADVYGADQKLLTALAAAGKYILPDPAETARYAAAAGAVSR